MKEIEAEGEKVGSEEAKVIGAKVRCSYLCAGTHTTGCWDQLRSYSPPSSASVARLVHPPLGSVA
ncbi:hypothetical protein CBOM_07689 [Ceraceosorus bombacis]|uniref:Uncharacterized protein n=1 Tax=Ceraceosorus bombacis TaxID=401625 RepID=A0A0N7LAS2_9BASI|nr:hypothetical protein CBOM_07689 [Ceraceosorus bombacis]